jgi:glycosyltransferase involved in cell wall biosynthesis
MTSRTDMPTVSVIVPNYNHARYLPQRIGTILRQTFQDFELILLDDCSTDDSRSILREYASDPRVHAEFNEVNSGSTFKQWNKGVKLARGKYIWIAESDDYADVRFLERLVAVLDGEPEIAFAFCRSRCVSENDVLGLFVDINSRASRRWAADFRSDGTEACRSFFLPDNPVSNASAVVFRKGIYEQVGGADENMRLCGDWKLWAAMALRGKIAYLCEPLNYFRIHEDSVRSKTRRTSADVTEHFLVARWILDRVTVSDALFEEICENKAALWVPTLMSLRVPLSLKRRILRQVRALDPHPFRRAFHPAITVVRLKIRRHWRGLRSMVGATRT